MTKEYIGSDEHFQDEVDAYYDNLEKMNKEQINPREQERIFYQVYINNNWSGDFDTFEDAETFINAHAFEGIINIEKHKI